MSQRHSSRSKRCAWLAGTAVTSIALVIGGSLWVFWPGSTSIENIVTFDSSFNAVADTDTLCVEIGCTAGWRTDYGNFLEFDTTGGAKEWDMILGDEGRRYKNIVLDFRGFDLSFDDRRTAIESLFSRHDWE